MCLGKSVCSPALGMMFHNVCQIMFLNYTVQIIYILFLDSMRYQLERNGLNVSWSDGDLSIFLCNFVDTCCTYFARLLGAYN